MNGPSPAQHERRRQRLTAWLLGLLVALVLLWTLRATAVATLPLACALFIGLAVWPLCDRVRNLMPRRLRWLGYVVAMLVVVGLLALFVAGIALALQQVAAGGTQYIPEIKRQLSRGDVIGLIGERQLAALFDEVRSYALSLLNATWHTVAGIVLIFFLVLLMLTEAGDWRAKLEAVTGQSAGRGWTQVGAAIGQRFRRYFLTRLALGAITGALYAAWLALFGIDFLLLWGMLALLLNFIPTIGSLIAGILPVLFALVQKDAGTAAIVAAGLLAIEQVMGNFVDPKVTGRQLSVSPLVVLVSLLLWGWVWGLAGTLLAVPMTVLITILFAHIPALKPVALFLSNERDMAGLEAHTAPIR